MNHLLPPLLLANIDIGEVIAALAGLLMLLLWVINQIAEGKKLANRPAAQKPAAPAKRPAAVQPGAQPQATGLRGEVEDFLRRTTVQQSAEQAGQAKRPVAPRKSQPATLGKIEVLVDEQGRMIDRRRPDEPRKLTTASDRRPKLAQPAPATPPRKTIAAKRESVSEHVQQHIDSATRAMGQKASRLGQRIIQDDADFDVQLKAKFDHEVGTLTSKERVTDTPSQSPVNSDTTSPAALLAAMLASPTGVQQAILMNEVLRRPSERW